MSADRQDTLGRAAPGILIVDDDPGQQSLLDSFLRGQGFRTVIADSGEKALELLRSAPVDMMISDVRMPGMSGLDTLRQARQEHATLPVLLVTAYTDIRDAVDAMRDGAVNYLGKPIDLDELLESVRQATGMVPRAPLQHCANRRLPEGTIAESPAMQAVFHEASLVAPSDARVLITGESGSGKEVVADVIHAWSGRAAGSLIKVNCAALPESLLESELFGHEKGSFTGAHAQRIGRFEEAHNGTIFLDEIAEMSAALQAKLLRVTQGGQFQRIGSNRELQTNARIVAATNHNLEEEVRSGRFREDLFYRLNVVEIRVPPLRERREDILPLAARFIAEFASGRAQFAASVAACLRQHAWPGNVRELRNAMQRAVLLSGSERIMPEHLPNRLRDAARMEQVPAPDESQPLEDVERDAILRALRAHRFNRSETARALGINRRTLLYKLQRFQKMGFEIAPRD